MSTAKRLTHIDRTERAEGYFEDLNAGTQALVRALIEAAASERKGPEGFKTDEEAFKDVECHSRDGFIPFSHNRGGLMYRNFATLSEYWGGGYSLAHDRANEELHARIESELKDAREAIFDENEELLSKHGFTRESLDYHALYETKNQELKAIAERLSDQENDNLSGENSTVMHEIRVMYHGKIGGLHSASVSAAVNLEAPYHRSHIAWAPGVFCEGGKEVEITWRNQAELKRKLARALKQVSKAVF